MADDACTFIAGGWYRCGCALARKTLPIGHVREVACNAWLRAWSDFAHTAWRIVGVAVTTAAAAAAAVLWCRHAFVSRAFARRAFPLRHVFDVVLITLLGSGSNFANTAWRVVAMNARVFLFNAR